MRNLVFGNPAGAWALLAVPAIFAIHFLQERTWVFPVSTLFLLGSLEPATPRGVVFRRLRSSWTLWMQVIAALLLAWVFSEPRWVHAGAWRRITLIIDDSASMGAFRERVLTGLEKALRPLAGAPVYTEWTVLAASRAQDPLYRGFRLDAALEAVRRGEWVFPEGDLHRALTAAVLARGTVPGAVFWVTDRQREGLPAGVRTLAFGDSLSNCGWAGLRVWREGSDVLWEALVRNWSPTEQKRVWWWRDEAGETGKESIELPAGGLSTLRGAFPAGVTQGRLQLSSDAFALDDALDLVAPQPRPMHVGCSLKGAASMAWIQRVVATVPGAEFLKQGEVHLLVAAANEASLAGGASMVLFAANEFPAPAGVAVGEDHPLVSGLDWQGLLLATVGDLSPEAGDSVLVWRGGMPLIWLGNSGGAPRLMCNFTLSQSNADRLPAMVLLLGRFFSRVQSSLEAYSRDNALVGGVLNVTSGKGWTVRSAAGGENSLPLRSVVRAPWQAGFFQVLDAGKKTVFDGASQFLDPGESDFAAASSFGGIGDILGEMDNQQTEPDRFTELWILLAGMAMVGAWMASTRGVGRSAVSGTETSGGGRRGEGIRKGGRDVV